MGNRFWLWVSFVNLSVCAGIWATEMVRHNFVIALLFLGGALFSAASIVSMLEERFKK